MVFKPAYWEDPHKTKFKARVEDVKGEKVILSKTHFHPEGGGQPADKGTLDGFTVEDVQKDNAKVVHYVPGNDFEEGDMVEGNIDERFRYYCMRAHTGSHIVYGAGRRVFDEISYFGFEISDEKIRIDFETGTDIDRDVLLTLEEKSNKVILESRRVNSNLTSKEMIEDMNDIAFAKELPDEEKVRVVKIEGWDKATCSGTHLQNTSSVGRINITGKKKLQEGITRVEFKVGEEALKQDYRQKKNLLQTEKILETNHELLPRKVRELINKNEELSSEIEELNEDLLEYQFSDLESYDMVDYTLKIGSLSTDNTKKLSHLIKDEVERKEVITVVNKGQNISVIVGVGEDVEEVDADSLIDELSQEYCGGGGGTEKFAQGGGFKDTAEEIISFIKDTMG